MVGIQPKTLFFISGNREKVFEIPVPLCLFIFRRSKLLLIELIPHGTIVILNSFILVKIVKSSKFRCMRNIRNLILEGR